MQESQPPIENRETKRNLARELKRKALGVYMKDEGPYNIIIEFSTHFRAENPEANNFLLLHDLISSTFTDPQIEASMPLDTPDGQIEKFIRKELAKLS